MIRYFFILVVLLISEQIAAEQTIEVKDDNNKGVYSKIYIKDENNYKGDTDKAGIFVLGDGCQNKDIIIAKPKSPLYESGKKECNAELKKLLVKVTWKPVYTNLIKNREVFLARGEYGAAALASNEIAARTINLETAQEAKVITIELLAKHIKISPGVPVLVYDPLQEKKVPSAEMVKAIKKYQVESGLPKTGIADYRTLSTAAGREVGSIMFHQIK